MPSAHGETGHKITGHAFYCQATLRRDAQRRTGIPRPTYLIFARIGFAMLYARAFMRLERWIRLLRVLTTRVPQLDSSTSSE